MCHMDMRELGRASAPGLSSLGPGTALWGLAAGQWSAASAHFPLAWGPSHISSHFATDTALSRRLSWERRPAGSW